MIEKHATVRPGLGADVAVALDSPKFAHNVGAAVRAASCFGVPQVWMSGNRVSLEGSKGYRLPREERMRGYQEVQLCHADYFLDAFARGIVPVAVELRPASESLLTFEHPERAVYVFGPEDGSIGPALIPLCHRFVSIPARHCLNLSSAVYTVLFHRHAQRVAAGLEAPYSVVDERGFLEPDDMREEVGVR